MNINYKQILYGIVLTILILRIGKGILTMKQLQVVAVVGLLITLYASIDFSNEQNIDDEPIEPSKLETLSPHKLLFFYTDWCGYCKQFKPEWEIIEMELMNNPMIETVPINGDENKELVKSYSVPGFPTLMMEMSDGQIIPYSGNRDANSVLEFVSQFN